MAQLRLLPGLVTRLKILAPRVTLEVRPDEGASIRRNWPAANSTWRSTTCTSTSPSWPTGRSARTPGGDRPAGHPAFRGGLDRAAYEAAQQHLDPAAGRARQSAGESSSARQGTAPGAIAGASLPDHPGHRRQHRAAPAPCHAAWPSASPAAMVCNWRTSLRDGPGAGQPDLASPAGKRRPACNGYASRSCRSNRAES